DVPGGHHGLVLPLCSKLGLRPVLSVQRMKKWIKAKRMLPAKALMGLLRLKLEGYYRYHGIMYLSIEKLTT
ncbi:MAG: hypothetical protein ACPL5F_09540, partial [Moorellaceae bacterium]